MPSVPVPPAAAVADALVRLGRVPRVAPSAIRRLAPGSPIAGPAVPCRHSGSVDVFLEAIERAGAGGILVIDNAGRLDEGCIGDLTVGEAAAAGIAGMVVDGCHRDGVELGLIGLPVWSRGSTPVGPLAGRAGSADRLQRARIGDIVVTPDDVVVADDDGVLFLAAAEVEEAFRIADEIVATERAQADRIKAGTSLRAQLGFDRYLERRAADPSYDFRRHLRESGGAIET
ncbi:MAG TPA: RraA family protein [Candidatus Limnocylindrales bacterium]|nr:RraA family protein [Candidatus Limnocylindrales bacterium]